MAKSPEQSLKRFQQAAPAAAGRYREGVRSVTEAPGAKAGRRQAEYLRGVQEASDRWAQNVAAVPLDEWKRQAEEKGGTNYSTGVSNLSERKKGNMRRQFEIANQVSERISSMPDGSLQERIQRMVANAMELHERKGEAKS